MRYLLHILPYDQFVWLSDKLSFIAYFAHIEPLFALATRLSGQVTSTYKRHVIPKKKQNEMK